MKLCILDPFSGIAGDMTVAALIDAGADAQALIAGLDSLGTGARYTVEKTKRKGIAATRFQVAFEDTKKHRHLPHILKMIEAAALPEAVKRNAAKIFQVLGEAEASVHGVPLEKVHFHEVGAIDSISDIVGAAYAFHLLDVTEVHCTPINTGHGTVNTEHGILPVPTPATAKLLEGKPVYARGPATEMTTPTGAAIVAAMATSTGVMPAMTIERTGFGAGTKEFPEHANVLRVLIGEASGATEATTIRVLEANIDDASPQLLGYVMQRLLDAGALDVTFTPVFMKKQRPATQLAVLARPEDAESLAALLFAETTTAGLRITTAERRVLERQHVGVETPYGSIRMKVTPHGAAPEYDDCVKAAAATGKPLKEIFAAAQFAYRKNQ